MSNGLKDRLMSNVTIPGQGRHRITQEEMNDLLDTTTGKNHNQTQSQEQLFGKLYVKATKFIKGTAKFLYYFAQS